MIKEPRTKITATIRKSYLEKLEKIRGHYKTKSGKPFTFSGVLSLVLKDGFEKFEEKNKVVINTLKDNREKID